MNEAHELHESAHSKVVEVEALGPQPGGFVDCGRALHVVAEPEWQEEFTPLLECSGEQEDLLLQGGEPVGIHGDCVQDSLQTSATLIRGGLSLTQEQGRGQGFWHRGFSNWLRCAPSPPVIDPGTWYHATPPSSPGRDSSTPSCDHEPRPNGSSRTISSPARHRL